MSEDITKSGSVDDKLNLILAELADLRDWRTKVDAFIDERTRDTRPMLDRIHKEVADLGVEVRELKDRVGRIDRKFDMVASDLMELRAAQRDTENRVSGLERKVS